MLAQSFQKFRLLVIEPLDRFRVRFAFSDHLPDLVCRGATLNLTGFRLLQFRAFGRMTGCLTHHDATLPNRKTFTGFQLSTGTVFLFVMYSNCPLAPGAASMPEPRTPCAVVFQTMETTYGTRHPSLVTRHSDSDHHPARPLLALGHATHADRAPQGRQALRLTQGGQIHPVAR